MINVTNNDFRRSAQTKKAAAEQLVDGRPTHPSPAVYLSHVALECALKLRILTMNSAERVEDLRNKLPDANFLALFTGSAGHDLHRLAETATIHRYLTARAHPRIRDRREWTRMAGNRPYLLRYGSEIVSQEDARVQVRFAGELTDIILQGSP